MKKYHVERSMDLSYLILKVNDMIKENWEPIGGIVCINNNNKVEYLQTLILKN